MSWWTRALRGPIGHIFTLMTGTLLAQVISVGFTPLLTRIYSPSEFGVLGLVNGAATVVVGIAALRYDMAVVLPRREGEAVNLVWLAFGAVAGTALVSLIAVGLFRVPIAAQLGSAEFGDWLWAAPLIVFVTGLYNVLTNWTTRHKKFRRLSISAVLASGASAGSKLGAGSAGLGVVGLVGGQVFGQLVALLVLGAQVWRDDAKKLTRLASRSVALRMARHYAEFPKYHAPMSLAFTLSYNMPLYIVGLYFSELEVGYWSLTVLVLSTPVFLVGNAARQVLFQRISARLNEKQPVAGLLLKSTGALLMLAAVPAVAGWFLAPWGFGVLLGAEWEPAGHHAQRLLLWQVSVLAAMPSSAAFPALRLQRIMLPWQVGAIAVGAAALMWGGNAGDPLAATTAYSISMAAMNALFFAIVWRHAVRSDARIESGPP